MQLKDKTALVTGGSRGIGRAIALAMAAEGANIGLVYAGNQQAAEETVAQIEGLGVKVKAYRCDVGSYAETEQLAQQVLEDFGSLDILVNNAGIVRDKLIRSMKEEDFDQVIATNLKGSFNLIKHFYPKFMRSPGARIINIGSVVGLSGNKGQANYAAAKAGMIGLTKSTAKELASRGVTCNLIAPGFIHSEMTDQMPEKAKDGFLNVIPAGRAGEPEEVADLAVFLASEKAGYITGQVIAIDGGMTM